MKRLSVYLDTSIVSFLLADDEPLLRDITREFFASYLKLYDVAISDVLVFEIGKTRDVSRRARLLAEIQDHRLPVIDLSDGERGEVFALAQAYTDAGVIPIGKRDDALHLAIATVRRYDILLSWNFRHLANIHKQMRVNAVNVRAGYSHPLSLLNPMELMYEDDAT